MRRRRRVRKISPNDIFNYSRIELRKGDPVRVISGSEKGQIGAVLRFDRKKGKIYVEGVNTQLRSVKKSKEYPNGEQVHIIKPIHVSNVKFIDKQNNLIKLSDIKYNR